MNRWLVATAMVFGSLPACGSSAVSNPCTYVTAADVATVVGGPVGDGVVTTEMGPRPGGPSTSCEFLPRGTYAAAIPGSNADVQFVVVSFIDRPTYDEWRAMRQGPDPAVHPIADIGDDAFSYTAPHDELSFVARRLPLDVRGSRRVGLVPLS